MAGLVDHLQKWIAGVGIKVGRVVGAGVKVGKVVGAELLAQSDWTKEC